MDIKNAWNDTFRSPSGDEDNKIYSIDTVCHSVDELDLKNNTFILLASKRASGKTVLIKNIVKNLFEKFTFQAIIILDSIVIL